MRIKDLTYQRQIKYGDDKFIEAYILVQREGEGERESERERERVRGKERESERELSS